MRAIIARALPRVIWTLIGAAIAICAAADDAPRASHALLIGVGNYSGTGLDSLKGPVNDVALMRSLLKGRFAVPEANIVALLDAQATHTAIQSAFAGLAQRVKAGDSVYIYYSGHGSYTPDSTARSGQNETWVTFGARSKKSAGLDDRDVLSKEINQWLAPLYAKSKDLVFVSDSCHSATVSRGATGVRAAPPDPRPHPLALQRFDEGAALPGIRVGASRDLESAVELDVEQGGQCLDVGRCQGVFTWYWVQALQQAKPGERWHDIFNRTYARVTAQRGVSQRPQLEGHGEAAVFGAGFAPVGATIAVTAVDPASTSVTLAAGLVSGVTRGSVYRLFDSEAPNRQDLPAVEVTAVQPFASQAAIRSGKFKAGDLVVEATHAYPFDALRLHVVRDSGVAADDALALRIRQALKNVPGVSVVDEEGRADWVIRILRPGKDGDRYVEARQSGALPKSIAEQPPEAWIVNRQGRLLHERLRIALANPDRGIVLLTENIVKFARAGELVRLDAGNPPAVNVEVSLWRDDPACQRDCKFLPKDERKERPLSRIGSYKLNDTATPLRRGDVLTFALSNGAQDAKSWYAYLLDISSDGSIQTIFPGRYDNREEALLKPNEVRDLGAEFMYQLNDPGVEVIKLIASSTSIDARLFESDGYRQRGELNPLERLLAGASTSRTGEIQRYSTSEWGTAQAQFVVGQ
ncbi:MAG: caspase family protein [Betaproteobacteria bacterium]